MQIKMTIDECIEFADAWSKCCTFHAGSQGWRVVCMLLAEEVRRLRCRDESDEQTTIRQALDRVEFKPPTNEGVI